MQKQQSWLQRAHLNIVPLKNSCQVIHEARFQEYLQGLYSARFSANGEIIAASFGSGDIQIRNGKTGELIATLKYGVKTSMPIMCCRFNPVHKNIFYASSTCGNIFMCTTDTKDLSRFITEPKNEVNAIDVSVNGNYLVSGGKDATVRLYDTERAKLILMYKKNEGDLIASKAMNFHRMRIFASKFHNMYPNLVVTGGWDDTVRIWDIRVPIGSVRIIKGPHICGDAIDIHETHILTGSWAIRDSLQVWDLMSAKLIETINPQNRRSTLNGEFLYVVQYFDWNSYDNLILAGGSGINAVEVISLKEKKVMGNFNVNKPIFTLDSCESEILFGGMESVLTLGNYS